MSDFIHCPVIGIGCQNERGEIVLKHVLCSNFPALTQSELSHLSRAMEMWATTYRRERAPKQEYQNCLLPTECEYL